MLARVSARVTRGDLGLTTFACCAVLRRLGRVLPSTRPDMVRSTAKLVGLNAWVCAHDHYEVMDAEWYRRRISTESDLSSFFKFLLVLAVMTQR